MIIRKQNEKENRGKAGPHPRVRGGPVDVPLARMKATDENLVMDAIDLDWLENHPESNKPLQYQYRLQIYPRITLAKKEK